MKKLMIIFALALLTLSLTACTGMSDNMSSNMNSGSLSSIIDGAESKISSLLSNSGTPSDSTKVSRDEAIDKAVKHAGLKREDITNLEVDLDTESEGVFWEIEFDHKTEEYSYDINAQTGEITSSKREAKD